jgi:hypothetical protein
VQSFPNSALSSVVADASVAAGPAAALDEGTGQSHFALILSHAARHLTGTQRAVPQFNKGGYLLLDSLIMRGAYGPYGPAKTQVRKATIQRGVLHRAWPTARVSVIAG